MAVIVTLPALPVLFEVALITAPLVTESESVRISTFPPSPPESSVTSLTTKLSPSKTMELLSIITLPAFPSPTVLALT